ncbi:hypothetical protein BpHYR1_016623 [Brachionus plicatilis]|uniref:Secreted protein n=1 Tax=Brachionus plicatilis TaxID=10195 RepID=A0A3M7SKK6_BRAPC|nr:hypothetical protein BpHYR1_016623 [Brachionus plicatilis]
MSKISFVFSWLLITGIFSVPLDYPDRYDTTLPWSTTTTRVYCTLSCYPNSYEDYQDCTCHCYPGYYFDQSLYQCAQVLTDQNLLCKLKQLIYPLYQEYKNESVAKIYRICFDLSEHKLWHFQYFAFVFGIKIHNAIFSTKKI